MNLNICNDCGAEYGQDSGRRCSACGALRAEGLSPKEQELLSSAFMLLRAYVFDEAQAAFEDIIRKYPENAYAYWGRLRSRYHISLIPTGTGKSLPRCPTRSGANLENDVDFKKAMELADEETRSFFTEQADRLNVFCSDSTGAKNVMFQFTMGEVDPNDETPIKVQSEKKSKKPLVLSLVCSLALIAGLAIAFLMSGFRIPGTDVSICDQGHTPGPSATCTEPQICLICNTVLASKRRHAPGAAATCTNAQTCLECNTVLASALGHTPGAAASCTNAQTCLQCNTVLASALGHTPGAAATCTNPQTCTTCRTVLATANHSFVKEIVTPAALKSEATISSPAVYYKSCSCGRISTNSSETFTDGTSLVPVFARFDFGTASKAQDLGMTAHEYLVGVLTYDAEFITVDYTEDSIIVTAVQDHPEITLGEDGKESLNGYSITSYALCYDDLVTYDFYDELTREKNFIRFRIKNNTNNNIMSFRFRRATDSDYFTTTSASCMYLQGGAPTVDDYVIGDNKLVCEPDNEYRIYTYDINFLAALGRYNARVDWQGNSYVHYAYYVGTGGSTGSNNWNWMGTSSVSGLQFFVLGAFGGSATTQGFIYGDTRANIVEGATVEIDYIIFGAKDDLNSYTSYIQDEYNESVSVSESISVSISKSISVSVSEKEAATATTAG